MKNNLTIQGVCVDDIEKLFINTYERRSKMGYGEYMTYQHLISGSFDVVDCWEQSQKDHENLRGILNDMTNREIFVKVEEKYKLNPSYLKRV